MKAMQCRIVSSNGERRDWHAYKFSQQLREKVTELNDKEKAEKTTVRYWLQTQLREPQPKNA